MYQVKIILLKESIIFIFETRYHTDRSLTNKLLIILEVKLSVFKPIKAGIQFTMHTMS